MSLAKNVIMVRHGECVSNETDVYQAGAQFEIDPLNQTGRQQAVRVAERFANVPLDIILSTSYLRGVQTALPIQRVTGADIVVPVIEDQSIYDIALDDPRLRTQPALLRELDLPSELAGLHRKDPAAVAITDSIQQHLYEKGWKYSDEENLYNVWDRAGKILQYIEERPEETLAVVTHGGISKACLARILQKKLTGYTERQHLEIYQAFSAQTWWDNTGVISLRFSPKDDWQWLMTDNHHIGTSYFGFMGEDDQTKTTHSDTAAGDVYEV